MTSLLQPLEHSEIDYQRFFAMNPDISLEACIEQGMAGLAYQANLFQESATLLELRQYYLRNFAVHQLCMAKLDKVVHFLNGNGIEPLILRGPALVEQLYSGDGGLRRYSDVDLSVRPKDYPLLERCLTNLNLRRDSLYPQIWRLDGFALDCHSDPINVGRNPCHDLLFPDDPSMVFERAIPFRLSHARALVPNEMDQVALLAIHLVKHSFAQQIWEVDLVRCIELNFSGPRFESLRHSAQRSRLLHFVLNFLSLKYRSVGSEFLDSLGTLPMMARRLAVCLAKGPLPGSGPLTVLLCLPKERRRFLKSILWPNANVRNQIATDCKVADTSLRFLIHRVSGAMRAISRIMRSVIASTIGRRQ
jgi:hypothetical protein